MALTKAELAEVLFDKYGVSKQDTKVLVEDFLKKSGVALEKGEQVKLSGFGNFELRTKKSAPWA